MKKDLNWFKEQLEDIEMNTPMLWSHGSIWMLDRVNELLNQLDEPETLSEDWIYEKAIDTHVDTINGDIQVTFKLDDLQNLLVPKQEDTARKILDKAIETGTLTDYDKEYIVIEKPVVPQFVTEYIKATKTVNYHLLGAIYDGTYNEKMKEWLFKGDKKTQQCNQNKLTEAWLAYPNIEVEEEQKYVVPVIKNLYLKQSESGDFGVGSIPSEMKYEFTEQEIKDYDERYIPFMVPVDEVNND